MSNDSKKQMGEGDSGCKRRIEQLMERVLSGMANQAVEFHTLADKSEKRILTVHESELIRNTLQVYKALVKQRFLEEIIELEDEASHG